MRIDFLTLFPEFLAGFSQMAMCKRLTASNLLTLNYVQIRDFALDKHHRVDDRPSGGGAGLVMKVDVLTRAIEAVRQPDSYCVYLSPRGQILNQALAKTLASKPHLILLCGHYEGVDERVLNSVDLEVSLGDYILTGGELPSLVLADCIVRLVPGAISEASHDLESFTDNLLEYPQYTLPNEFNGQTVPEVLLSGNHQAVARYRLKESLRITRARRPDLFALRALSKLEKELLAEIEAEESISKEQKT